jgi:hypothetical protein
LINAGPIRCPVLEHGIPTLVAELGFAGLKPVPYRSTILKRINVPAVIGVALLGILFHPASGLGQSCIPIVG